MPPHKKHGGRREGAGRKPTGAAPKETTSISIDPAILAAGRARADALGISLSQLIERNLAVTEFYAIAHHGTAGLDSHGYAEVIETNEAPRADHTTTVSGPYATRKEAEAVKAEMQDRMDAFADR